MLEPRADYITTRAQLMVIYIQHVRAQKTTFPNNDTKACESRFVLNLQTTQQIVCRFEHMDMAVSHISCQARVLCQQPNNNAYENVVHPPAHDAVHVDAGYTRWHRRTQVLEIAAHQRADPR
eukprot:7379473-Pyramimonas_sp.AAC.2